jgi:hypothetical protein
MTKKPEKVPWWRDPDLVEPDLASQRDDDDWGWQSDIVTPALMPVAHRHRRYCEECGNVVQLYWNGLAPYAHSRWNYDTGQIVTCEGSAATRAAVIGEGDNCV